MKRDILFKLHFYLASFFTPFLLLIAITGTAYLLGEKGEVKSSLVKQSIVIDVISTNEVKSKLAIIDPNYRFEYIKSRGRTIQTRPTTRTYYQLKQNTNGTYDIYKEEPNLLRQIIEVHKGHGPSLLKLLQKILGISLIIIIITGLIMSLQIRKRYKSFMISMGFGTLLLFALFLL